MFLELNGIGTKQAQLTRALRAAIVCGRLKPGAQLPPTRELALELGLSRNTVLAVFESLRADGFLVGRVGAGSFVAYPAVPEPTSETVSPLDAQSAYSQRARMLAASRVDTNAPAPTLRYSLQYGVPMTNPALTTGWSHAVAKAAQFADTGYPPVQGLLVLRTQLCNYLARRRGVQARPEQMLIVSGIQQAMTLAARVLVDQGERVCMEEPGYFGARQLLAAHGADLVLGQVDGEGVDLAGLTGPPPKLAYVTPSHQFPSGVVMSLERRHSVLGFARAHSCWLLEDDYDGEFSYEPQRIPTLHALDNQQRVIYVGSFSKMLFPSLRLGFMVVPDALRADFIAAKWLNDFACPAIEQLALANFMADGGFERHLRHASHALQKRRTALIQALKHHLGGKIQIDGANAGMHLTVWFADLDQEELEALIHRARSRGLGLFSIRPHYQKPPRTPGLLLGFASLPPAELEIAVRLLAECLSEIESARRHNPGFARLQSVQRECADTLADQPQRR
jgi:GntR family transcriptional regulator/MocR family aminotransferase